MGGDKKRKQLLSRLKKREKNGIVRPAVVKPLAMKTGERNKFTNKNGMVLLAIEKTILALDDDQVGLDDRCVRAALASSIRGLSSQGAAQDNGSAVSEKDEAVETSLTRQLSENLKKRYDSFFPCLLYTSPSPRDQRGSRMPSSA